MRSKACVYVRDYHFSYVHSVVPIGVILVKDGNTFYCYSFVISITLQCLLSLSLDVTLFPETARLALTTACAKSVLITVSTRTISTGYAFS